ncbi:hypothetical protein ELI30_18860 [Rhizobium leguminosarum]|uniref:metallophosphoesterase n=1 Tax=Rhizobium leguminosarum TaxID=384 RepID=UPI00103027CA|nr:metallophosphoesterase [Rhizobium leguminosarum]TAV50228.1 hypothetical protein ELI32_19560 [Rhizobium leguminosarum]TAV59591.1 hypothetical protein ELI31_18080 [Rhizobium leguminosarum]TAV70638.1 hypothetical protein ELI30_18860 [Rhizobium leguminosarum]TAY68255.1 hypothetical protein ELH82_19745 [Rhizobium leguminosarum]
MRAWILSDLNVHIFRTGWSGNAPDADVCICAGNVKAGGLIGGVEWLSQNICPHMPVIFVPGNVDFFGSSIREDIAAALERMRSQPNLKILMGSSINLDGVDFFGDTLWTDFSLLGDLKGSMRAAGERLRDYREIRASRQPFKRFNPSSARKLHLESRDRIEDFLSRKRGKCTVMITHFAPSAFSLPAGWETDAIAPSLASNLERLIVEFQPTVWIHGHVHSCCDYWIQQTRVLCNSRGYPFEAAISRFDPELVIDLSEGLVGEPQDVSTKAKSRAGFVKSIAEIASRPSGGGQWPLRDIMTSSER